MGKYRAKGVTYDIINITTETKTTNLTGTPKKKYQLNKKPKHYTGFSKGTGKKITASDIKKKK